MGTEILWWHLRTDSELILGVALTEEEEWLVGETLAFCAPPSP